MSCVPGGWRLQPSQSRLLRLRESAGCTDGPPRPGTGRPDGSAGMWTPGLPALLGTVHNGPPATRLKGCTLFADPQAAHAARCVILLLKSQQQISLGTGQNDHCKSGWQTAIVPPVQTTDMIHELLCGSTQQK